VRKRGLVYSSVSVLVALVSLLSATPALAATAQPDTIAIAGVDAYRHVLEDDDLLVIVKYHLDYSANSTPDNSIEYTYLGRMMSGATELQAVTPYSYYNSGYDWGIFSFYFSTADAPAWEGSYTIRLEGNPALDWDTGVPPLKSTSSINWNATLTQAATEALLETRILGLADDLSDRWQVTLTEEVTGGTVLSSAGVQYFTNSISNLRTIVPDIFPTGVEAVAFTEEEHTKTYQTSLLGRIGTGDMLGRARASVASLLNIDNSMAGAILFFIFLGAIIWGVAYAGVGMKPVAFMLIPMVIMGNLLGLLSLTFTMVIGLLSVMASAYILFYRGSSA